ncbi:MAG: lipid-A-disaccharide synthase N-terminal domain-containing protein [Verrucomicrobiia bacterium]
MDWLTHLIWHDLIWHNGKLFGIEWSAWKVVGWMGNAVFSSRFLVQWYATEKKKQVVVPTVFWWLSLAGSLLLLIYALRQTDSVFIYAYLFPWVPYTRNLIIHYRHKKAHTKCPACGKSCPPQSNFCPNCGARLAAAIS